jgi:hypothetical protein
MASVISRPLYQKRDGQIPAHGLRGARSAEKRARASTRLRLLYPRPNINRSPHTRPLYRFGCYPSRQPANIMTPPLISATTPASAPHDDPQSALCSVTHLRQYEMQWPDGSIDSSASYLVP